MHLVNESAVPVEHRKSPGGAFEIHRRHLSVALGAPRDVGPWGGGHPFEVELATVPAGKKNYPYHSHAAQTEYYAVLRGSGTVIDGTGKATRIQQGDHFIVHPGEAHQIINDSTDDLTYFVIADNHRSDVTSYPKTGKRLIKPEMRCIRVEEVDYYDGEE